MNRRDAAHQSDENADAPSTGDVQAETKLRAANGVIRLLQEGHFHGVADVRLRINFADEIAALQTAASNDGAAGGDQPILDAVKKVVDDFQNSDGITPETTGQIESAFSDFQKAVQDLFAGFDGSKDPKGSTLIDALGTAFDNFVQAIQALVPDATDVTATVTLTRLEVTAPVEATGDTTTTSEPVAGPDFETFVTNLTKAFQDEISALQDQLDTAQVLPPLSGPNGNGKAYEKFLEILNGLSNGGATQDTPGVDTAA